MHLCICLKFRSSERDSLQVARNCILCGHFTTRFRGSQEIKENQTKWTYRWAEEIKANRPAPRRFRSFTVSCFKTSPQTLSPENQLTRVLDQYSSSTVTSASKTASEFSREVQLCRTFHEKLIAGTEYSNSYSWGLQLSLMFRDLEVGYKAKWSFFFSFFFLSN